MTPRYDTRRYVEAIRESGLSIYDSIEIGDLKLWVPTRELELMLDRGLRGISLARLPLRTRSKVVKTRVCETLGYPVPKTFTKTQPRFPGQCFDTYVQKSNNLQVWNQSLALTRRYVLIRVDEDDIIKRVRVVTGDTLSLLDTTGTLTQKYQARLVCGTSEAELIAKQDTTLLRPLTRRGVDLKGLASPIDHPVAGQLLPIAELFGRLNTLVGYRFDHRGYDQERNRGAALHALVCERLGYADYKDDGSFPDVRNQLLEIKLQTSPTIDLGLVRPDSTEPLDVPKLAGRQIRHCDVRYGLFHARVEGTHVVLTHFFLTTGERFFSRFPQFQGRILNKKLQIPLPADFFLT